MKLRNKKTGMIEYLIFDSYLVSGDIVLEYVDENAESGYSEYCRYSSLAKLNEEWEDAPADPLIKNEKVRKAVRAWAEANGYSIFRVYNHHFNSCEISGKIDKYNPNGSSIEFLGTIQGAKKYLMTLINYVERSNKMALKIAVIQLGQQQLDALMEFAETRSIPLAVDIVDSIIDDLGISDNRKVNND